MIVRIIDRIRIARLLDHLVLVTSTDPSDDRLAELVQEKGTIVRRGPLEDVLSRFEMVRREFQPTTIVRLTGDNALTDPAVIDLVLSAHIDSNADYTSNAIERTFPHGLDVECFESEAFVRMQQFELSPAEREHVTLGMYTRPSHFILRSVIQSLDQSFLRWTVDYPEDLEFVRQVYARLLPVNPQFDMHDVLRLIAEHPQLARRGSDLSP